MMRCENQITRENALGIIKKFASKYRKQLGKIPGEIIIVGGGSIMLNYGFRDSTQDFDVILRTASGVSDVITEFADENGLPRDWMNNDFMKTASYSPKLAEVSVHLISLNNGTLEIRTVTGKYLIAMKVRAHRAYRNDVSDIIGIAIEEEENGNKLEYESITEAYQYLYGETISKDVDLLLKTIFSSDLGGLKKMYEERNNSEHMIGTQVIEYIEDGAPITVRNVDEVISRIKEKLDEQNQ